jgi:hypothetical protein
VRRAAPIAVLRARVATMAVDRQLLMAAAAADGSETDPLNDWTGKRRRNALGVKVTRTRSVCRCPARLTCAL